MTRSAYLGLGKRSRVTGSREGISERKLEDQRELQEALLKIPQVRKAQVSGTSDQGPREIHVITTSARSPKQTVRDIQSLAAAAFGVRIDHRIVSVVQLDEGAEDETSNRVVIERVGVGTRAGSEWVEVELRWADGQTAQGTGAAGRSRESRARGAAAATLECLDKVLSARRATVELGNVVIHKMGSMDWVLVHCALYEDTDPTALMGSALVRDDLATAAARALLNALNRKLQLG